MSSPAIEVVSWGIGGSVRDVGRVGRASMGAGRGGAVDLPAVQLANRLVGNPHDAGAIESSGGLRLRVTCGPVMVSVTGGLASIDVVGGPPVGWGEPIALPTDAELRVGRFHEGNRVYLAVRGGLARDLTLGHDPGTAPSTVAAPRPAAPDRIRLWPGPRLAWFDDDAWTVLTSSPFVVTPDCDRVGMRLSGPALTRVVHRELPSEGMVEGAVQVPPDGSPIVMLADHPVTGGYPVVAVVDPRDLGPLSQKRSGEQVRFIAAR